MDFLQSALGLATQQRNLPRQELDTMYARSNQAGQQVMQNAQVFSSMADRAAQREEQSRQFDILQAMREQEFELRKNESMASLAERNARIASENLSNQEKERAALKQPQIEAASIAMGQAFSNIAANAKTAEEAAKLSSAWLNQNSHVYGVLPMNVISAAQLSLANQVAQNAENIARAAQDTEWKQIRANAINARLNLDMFRVDNGTEQGTYDYAAIQDAIDAKEQEKAQRDIENAAKKEKAVTSARYETLKDLGVGTSGKPILDENGNPIESPLPKGAAIASAARYRKMAEDTQNPALKKQYIGIAEELERQVGVGGGSTSTGTPTPSQSSNEPRPWFDRNVTGKVSPPRG